MGMRNRIALITGGAQGLGKYLATHLASRGHQIIVFDIKPFKDLSGDYRSMLSGYHQVDIAEISGLQQAGDDVIHKYERVDILVNNAAMRVFNDFSAFNEQEITAYANVNVIAPILLVKKFFPIMKKHGYGRIINIASKSVFWGYRTGTLYCSTKSALVTFTEAFGRELNVDCDNVTINAICPDSFSSVYGDKFAGCDNVVNSVERLIDTLLESKRNAEIIPILLGRSKLHHILRRLYEILVLFKKY